MLNLFAYYPLMFLPLHSAGTDPFVPKKEGKKQFHALEKPKFLYRKGK